MPPADHDRFAARRNKLRRLVKKSGASAILVTNVSNVTYLTGFTGHDSYLLVSADTEVLLSDPRYSQQVEEQCPGLELASRAPGKSILATVQKLVKSVGVNQLAFEAASVTVAERDTLAEKLTGVSLIPTTGLVEELREIKDAEEIATIRQAIHCAEKAFAAVRAAMHKEQTERQVAADLEYQVRRFGGSGLSFPPIVGVGERAALPHGVPTDKKIGEDSFVLIDWGAVVGGYVSDLTRVLATGKISPKIKRIYDIVLQAQLRAIDAIKPGALLCDVDKTARDVIAEAGFGKRFGHGLGHGIGLNVHESPRFNSSQTRPLQVGMVVTVEPGIYIPGFGGVRIEDDVLVTKTGHEVLTSVPKDFDESVID
ncbi:Xaa-Pro peptidase family protein [Blastopirellula sp. JC732]|uniref:Xaa-Pro peptidase family protein n=1 Tax=Blastopirellula sediminis TaxID=2894196 RepID=A0A9X1MUK2_9BACT|nr:Xaa-Pro peptidase family protein [Blastopirellula sediminis]MCC9604822.1 Xaa-Pro peptidase family protein [Blastopirellula sediminis]MCC9631879.1 Xaa-Pro peptidase family protein [Blastopirellula sediminis]